MGKATSLPSSDASTYHNYVTIFSPSPKPLSEAGRIPIEEFTLS
jgi:hypothetical protein